MYHAYCISSWIFVAVDTGKKLSFTPRDIATDSFLLHYTKPDKDHLLLSGHIGADSIRVFLKQFDINRFRLVNRSFHWINETPYSQ